MQRYYFDFIEGHNRARDDDGVEFQSLHEAHDEAMTTLAQAVKDAAMQGKPPRSLSIEVRDRTGLVLAVRARLESELLR
ncbi:DUF6894 family protein [Bradyrhizobium sp. Bra78]|uniref:DUF6894 family protein n=1 Tax=Bradyrhizobium sp. Bra78 TaxID=2926010 RepID=UPI0021C70AEE|nr:hypothetical protein [Bradyrhizobium sp. Bra78]